MHGNVIIAVIIMVEKKNLTEILKYCIGQTGIIYNFNIQNLVTYEDNLRYKGNMLLVIYIDF